MRTKYILILILFLNSFLYSQQSGWIWQNPRPQGNVINSIYFINNNTGFLTGFAGVVLKTNNSGLNWTFLSAPTYRNNYSVQFCDENTGIIAGKGIIKTTDGGITWQQKLNTDFYFNSLSFINSETGYLTGYTGSIGVIYKTTDGGNNFQIYNITKMLNCIQMINENTGYCSGQNTIYKTTNSGETWFSLGAFNTANGNSMNFINVNTGFTCCVNGNICKTTNAGVNWNIMYSGSSSINGLYFQDLNTGFAVCNSGIILKTSNCGNIWETAFTGSAVNLASIRYIGNKSYIAAGENGIIYKTSNDGQNWFNLSTSVSVNEINSGNFINQNTGYFFAQGEIIKTTNQGLNWSSTQIDSVNGMSGGYVDSSGNIYLYGYNFVKRSTNAGLSFSNIFGITNNQIYCAYFINSSTGYIGSSNNKIFKTTDSGITWKVRYPSPNNGYFIKDMLFVNDSIGYACGSNSWVSRTTNAGKIWMSDYLGYPYQNNDIYFINNSTGFITSTSYIHKTTNSGINWIRYDLPFVGELYSINFTNSNVGYVCGNLGRIYKTSNGGINWNELVSNSSQYLYVVRFLNSQTGFVFGRNGTIMKTTDAGGQITGKESEIQNIPLRSKLSQNYPNPFNPVTNIKFSIPISGFVKIMVYDMLGREITKLVNQQMQAGNYSVDWDAPNYPSGVYFYKLETDGFTESKKMVLTK